MIATAAADAQAVLLAEFDLAALAEMRDNWFVFRDRRPELYAPLLSHDGRR
jgi:N-carbamoylputrescine amidase